MTKAPKRPRDPNQLGKMVVDIATGQVVDRDPKPDKNEAAAELGKRGGKARAASMSPARRAEIAKKAADRRWHKP